MSKDLREQILLFLEFMSKYAHLDLHLLTLRQLLAQFEKETDSLLDGRERRMFRELTLSFVAKRISQAPSSSTRAASSVNKVINSSQIRVAPPPPPTHPAAPQPISPAADSFSTPLKAPIRLLTLQAGAGLGASPAGSDCSQVSLDGIAGLVRQTGARILTHPQQQQQQQPAPQLVSSTNSIIRIPITGAGGQPQVIHLSVQRIAPNPVQPVVMATTAPQLQQAPSAPTPAPIVSTPAANSSSSNIANATAIAAAATPIKLARLSSGAGGPLSEYDKRALSNRYSELLRVHKESGLEFPKRELASALDLEAKVATLETWLLARGLAWPLSLESARLFASSNRLAASTGDEAIDTVY